MLTVLSGERRGYKERRQGEETRRGGDGCETEEKKRQYACPAVWREGRRQGEVTRIYKQV
jgi:hypothetical protein